MTQQPVASAANELGYVSSGLHRHTNWWGAFVIGLAGTILVTGIAPVMATTLPARFNARPRPGPGGPRCPGPCR